MNKRFLTAMVLTFLCWSVYLRWFSPRRPPLIEPPVAEGAFEPEATSPLGTTPPATDAPKTERAAPVAGQGSVQDDQERTIEVVTPLYRAELSNRGGILKRFVLGEHRGKDGKPLEMVAQVASETLGVHPLNVTVDDPSQNESLRRALFKASTERLSLASGEVGILELVWSDGRGLSSVRRLEFTGGSYALKLHSTVSSSGGEIPQKVWIGPGLGDESLAGRYVQPDKGFIEAGSELKLLPASSVDASAGASVNVQVVGVSGHYFAGLLVATGKGYAASLRKDTLDVAGADGKKTKRDFITAAIEVPRGPADVTVFIGPKEEGVLRDLAPDLRLEALIEYGDWLRHIVRPLHQALQWTYAYVGNYGWAIVLLTVAINVLLSPLKHFSYISMRKMQALAPQVKRIQERYKKLKPTDPRRQEMNAEVLSLYREHKVSPFSGCLPMVLMIPFFFAFYRLLSVSIELRHAPFFGWVQDLSGPDPFYVLPILMGVSQIVIQKMTPQTTADPVQAKMMMIMPAVFVVFLVTAPSGLVLYWFVNNLISLGQQLLTNRLVSAS